MPDVVYFDWNATSPPHPDVVAAMREAQDHDWANPSSIHAAGRQARRRVEDAREAVARLLGFDARDVVMTGGGTEANNLALALAEPLAGKAIVVGKVEHLSVVRAAERLADRGVHVAWVAPDPTGVVTVDAVMEAVDRAAREGTVELASIQAVNQETGVVQPIAAIAERLHARGIRLHVDAVQAAGKLSADGWAGADLVAIAAHKFRGPKGIGALATKPGLRVLPVVVGGPHERGIRPGTQDASACAGFAVAAERARTSPARYADVAVLRDRLEAGLVAIGAELGVRVERNGTAHRAPHVTNLSFAGWRGDELAAALDLEGIAVASGSACSAGTAAVSPVIRAMLGDERASSAVRWSLGDATTAAEIDEALGRARSVLARSSRK